MSKVWWNFAQGASALAFGAFLCVHLVGSATAAWSPAVFDRYLLAVRPLYQHPVVEPIVFGSIVVHLVAGWLKPKPVVAAAAAPVNSSSASASAFNRRNVHKWAGYIMTIAIGGHTFATRFSGAALLFNGLSYTTMRLPYVFIPYYIAFGAAGAIHLIVGLPLAASMAAAPFPCLRPWVRRIPVFRRAPTFVVLAASGAVILGVLGLSGALYPYTTDRTDRHVIDFDDQIAQVKSLFGL